jgi:hypothetical protein
VRYEREERQKLERMEVDMGVVNVVVQSSELEGRIWVFRG